MEISLYTPTLLLILLLTTQVWSTVSSQPGHAHHVFDVDATDTLFDDIFRENHISAFHTLHQTDLEDDENPQDQLVSDEPPPPESFPSSSPSPSHTPVHGPIPRRDGSSSGLSSGVSASPAPSHPQIPLPDPTLFSGRSSCVVSGATQNSFRMNIGGAAISAASMGAENTEYIDTKHPTGIYISDAPNLRPSRHTASWVGAFSTYRWVRGSVLKYRIPIPRGTYTVKLLFAESLLSSKGARLFDIFVNGVKKEDAFDIFGAVGSHTGLVKEYHDISAISFIEIALIRVRENPIISGIMIEGPGAGKNAVGGGCSTDAANALLGGSDHRAHSVPNGPYTAVDFKKKGYAMVSLDGTLSHSHYSDPGPPEVTGQIVSYKWSWTEIVNGVELMKQNNDRSGKFEARFPLGKTIVTLEVVDNTGDVSADFAIVEVKPATKEGAYCYAYDFDEQSFSGVPLPLNISSPPKPEYGDEMGELKFESESGFGDFSFAANSFAYRCEFMLNIKREGYHEFSVTHNGPFRLYGSGVLLGQSNAFGETNIEPVYLTTGLSQFQILYFRSKSHSPKLVLRKSESDIGENHLLHDSSRALPVISQLSETTSVSSGGGKIQIHGSGFLDEVSVFVGSIKASNVIIFSSKLAQAQIPPGAGEVFVTVSTANGVSNGVKFEYISTEDTLQQPVQWKTARLINKRTKRKENLPLLASAVYGPDYRLYLGTYNKGLVHALGINKNYRLNSRCSRNIGDGRSVLGLAFSPFSKALRLYFTSSTLFWKKFLPFERGWVNGKIETIDFSRKYRQDNRREGKSCAFNQQDVVTGLPVSAHDHSVNKLEFMPDGRLLIGIGGFTNGGISVPGRKRRVGDPPDDRFGGVASNPLSAAIVSCPVGKVTNIVYDEYVEPEKAKIIGGKECFVYASGIRNSFGMTLHTNGHLYATDNGPSRGNGPFATDCNGGSKPSTKLFDKLFLVEKGKYHGHPNLNRKECEHYPPYAVQPILDNIESSTDGIVEYRSNTFGGQIKGDLFLTKFASNNKDGQISQVRLGPDGRPKSKGGFVESFYERSGLVAIEGPRGEIAMPQVYQNGVIFVYPVYRKPTVTFLIGVLPKRGPATGGMKVLISGHNFGSSPTATFDGKPCTKVRLLDKERFTCEIPPAARRNLQVSVVVNGTTGLSPSYGSDFWYF